ncbi:MFS transporter [Nonomuraea basaltis]|uniref:MFS transporter n=1 Tax=Nonomuraea basaltis TaxID=2495887 RepID=UPI00110C49E0|nr:MFS transporter [Nonomuraea basaltis]TMR97874.1 MFS transporter [Nonomuraea basaltis]
MKATAAQVRSFNRPIRLLLINQLTINIGFYMLMPYLATYLTDDLGLAAWMAGLVLGVRNLSQQGMFLLGGSLADRLGYKPMILAGLALRTVGFGLLGLVHTVPALIVASALTGLAGALFNPAARAYLAQEAGERKVEAFAVFNVFYQCGILIGPIIGLLLQAAAFQLTCLVAAGLFGVLAAAQVKALPGRRGNAVGGLIKDWREVVSNRPFLLFAMVMTGSYVLNFQIYLSLPIEARQAAGGELGVALLFAVSGGVAAFGQVGLTRWVKERWGPEQAMGRGLWLMGASFLPLAVPLPGGAALAAVLVTAVLLTLGTMIVYPFEMTTIARFGGDRLVGTYYGCYNTISGLGIAAGNLGIGAAIDAAGSLALPALPWWALLGLGWACAAALFTLRRTGRLRVEAAGLAGSVRESG